MKEPRKDKSKLERSAYKEDKHRRRSSYREAGRRYNQLANNRKLDAEYIEELDYDDEEFEKFTRKR